MINDPKLEQLLEKVRVSGRYKDQAIETLEHAKADMPKLESTVQERTDEYEVALYELAEYVKSV